MLKDKSFHFKKGNHIIPTHRLLDQAYEKQKEIIKLAQH
jgi:hypothetical protein